MNIKQALEDAKAKRQELVSRINSFEQEKLLLLQEALRLDGEIRILERIIKENAELEKG